jgi:hypothetical protein
MRKSSMFAEVPLDNHMVNKFAAPQLLLAFLDHPEPHRDRSDLKFRRGWLFCNIEPKICQYG